MRSTVTVTPAQLPEVLPHVAVVRPVFRWGAPGIGKSSLVRKFAAELDLECVTQLAPEDLIGVPELAGGRSRFAPPETIARHDPYRLFLDELNASSPEVRKAFYSLILDRRIGAGNRAVDNALALSWDAQLAWWFEEFVPAAEKRRTYARASRRQASTPDIPRPGWVRPETLESRPTFGVVLDTSGSMDPKLLGKALGAIASYAAARDVPATRVVFCDAMAYDAGYVPVEDIAGRVTARGRGGTVPRLRRDHAFLIPAGAHLPFRARGPVFRMS